MKSRAMPANNRSSNTTSTPAKRTLFRVALTVAMVGVVAVSTILILHGGLALGRLRYFVDIGLHPLHVSSAILLLLGLLSLTSFVVLTTGILKINRTLVMIAAGLSALCSLGLMAFSVWSFVTLTSGRLPASISNSLVKELNQTQYSISTSNFIVIENTAKMARLEKQHRCCGLSDPIDDYRSRQPAVFGSLNPSSLANSANPTRGRTATTQRNTVLYGSTVLLPISCCIEKYRSADNLCVDTLGNNNNPLLLYNTDGCYAVIARHKYARIQKQGFMTIVTACLAVISCVALAAVVRLLNEGYQIIALRTPM